MGSPLSLLLVALLAADPTMAGETPQPSEESGSESVADEVKGGAGITPVELIPRLELRQSFAQLPTGASVHVTTTRLDIQFLDRLLLRYEGHVQVVNGPAGQVSGFGDAEVDAIGLLTSNPRFVAVAIAGVVLDTASQPQLGAGKKQLVLGGGAAMMPLRGWLGYLLVQEQISVAGDSARADINQLVVRLGNVVFGPQFAWLKLDLDTVIDFAASAGRFFGQLEAGRLIVGRVGLFMRTGTQLLGTRQVDYTLEAGVRYLFRLGQR